VVLKIDSKRVFWLLIGAIAVQLALNLVSILAEFKMDPDKGKGLVSLFSMDHERSVPTMFSSVLLLIAATVLMLIAKAERIEKRSARPWFALAGIFLFLSVDEFASIHERLISPTRDLLNASGLFYSAWVIPYGVLLLVFVLSFRGFLNRLSTTVRSLILLAGALYVFGAIGFESLGGWHFETVEKRTVEYAVLYTCEEVLEMVGVSIFLYSLLVYLSGRTESLSFEFKAQNAHENAESRTNRRCMEPERKLAEPTI